MSNIADSTHSFVRKHPAPLNHIQVKNEKIRPAVLPISKTTTTKEQDACNLSKYRSLTYTNT